MSRFFISYRREDSAAEAGRLYDLLSQRFGRDGPFMDVDTVLPGVDFRRVTERHLRECQVLLAIIGKDWQDIRDRNGLRRLEAPDDFVRFEIESALARGITVIPVLFDGAKPPPETALPDSLKPLSRLQAFRIDTAEFHRDAEELLKILAGLAPGGPVRGRARSWAPAIVVSTALAVLVAMAVTRVGEVPVELRLRVSQLAFRLVMPQPAVSGLSTGRLGVAGLSEVRMPATEPVAQSALLLEAMSSAARISLPPLVLPVGARVWFGRSTVANEVQIGFQGPPLEFQANVEGQIRIGPADSKAYVLTFDTPARVQLKAESGNVVELSATLMDGQSLELSREVSIDSLSLTAVEEAHQVDPVVRAVSSIERGNVVFWPGAGPSRELARGDRVWIDSPRGQLKAVTFEDGLFDIRFAGTVRDLRTGSGDESVTTMPSYLEGVWANHRMLFLFAIVACVVIAVLLGARRSSASAW